MTRGPCGAPSPTASPRPPPPRPSPPPPPPPARALPPPPPPSTAPSPKRGGGAEGNKLIFSPLSLQGSHPVQLGSCWAGEGIGGGGRADTGGHGAGVAGRS